MKPLAGQRVLDLLRSSFLCASLAVAGLAGCNGSDGDTGPAGPPGGGGPTSTALSQGDDLPGITVAITGLSGGTAAGGRFRPGDVITISFTAKKDDGSDWDVTEFSTARTLVSGPTFNYQRIIAEQSDVATRSVQLADGSYTYTFASAIPSTYLAPLNDTPTFGAADGELAGAALLDGTYTVGLYFNWSFTVDGASKRDAGDVVADFVIGSSGTADAREVVAQDNCNRCHTDLQAHGGRRKSVRVCLLCHTAGAEDKNNGAGTLSPDVTIEFKVMIHRIHSGEHLPSVLGIDTNPDGSRNYVATPVPFQIIGNGNSVIDFSGVAFPAWPNGLVAMPRDEGYTALTPAAKLQEDTVRMGPSNCAVCHGDPDGSGPIVAPAQGDLHRAQPSQAACGACHDDVHWGELYTANGQTMPTTADNSNCILCHTSSGDPLSVADAHLHPLLNPNFNPGLDIDVSSLVEAGTNNADGTIDPGEKIAVTFTIQNDAGADVLPSAISNLSAILSGPTENYNIVLSNTIPTGRLIGAQPFTTTLPMTVLLDRIGVSTGALETFTTGLAPLWNISGAATAVLVRTGLPGGGGTSTLSADSTVPQNWIDVANGTGFARDDYIVIDDGVLGLEEYARIQTVQGTRLWFGTTGTGAPSYLPSLRFAHSVGASVKEVTLATKTLTTDYTVNPTLGTITEVTEFGAGNVVLSNYTTDFVMPSTYPTAMNDSGDLDESFGKWAGKSIVDGTYSLSIWSSLTLNLPLFGESNSYRSASNVTPTDFLVGAATSVEHYDKISSGNNCYNCHQDVEFHGAGRRSFDACVICHGTAGSEDRPQLIAANAPATSGATINFRTMLHKIHMGEDLANASTYTIVGFGSGAYPNNFGLSTFEEVAFPAMPGGVRNCAKCHGDTNDSWKEPIARNHPTEQGTPTARWAVVCGACHDGSDAQAHIQVQTTPLGAESCAVCHGAGAEWSVERMHKSY